MRQIGSYQRSTVIYNCLLIKLNGSSDACYTERHFLLYDHFKQKTMFEGKF